jgi:hypothetical protein
MKKILYNIIAICTFVINSFAQAPTISSFTPSSGSIGTLVTITGTNLNNVDSIKIGGVSAVKISSTSTNLVAMVMPGSSNGVIYISNASGNVTSSNIFTKIDSKPPIKQQGNKLVGTGAIGTAGQGNAVSLSADGNTAIVGGHGDSNYGAVWVYIRNGNTWTQQGNKLVGTGSSGTPYQGTAVSLSADGNTAIVSGPSDSNKFGAIWIFVRNKGFWSQQGNKLVGTGSSGTPYQGTAVSLSADGNTAIVGGTSDSSTIGAVWVFVRNGGVWSQQGNKLIGTIISGKGYITSFGKSVSLSADGNTAIVSGTSHNKYEGAAWIFTRRGNTWTQQGNRLVGTGAIGNANQGTSVKLSADGNTAIIGGEADNNYQGAVWIFTRNGGVWSQQGNKLVGTGNTGRAQQGCSVSLSADGNTAIVGGKSDSLVLGTGLGAAWLYTRTSGNWSQLGSKLTFTGNSFEAYLGYSVSLSADGKTAIVGGPNDTLVGAAWVFSSSNNASVIELPISTFSNINLKPNPFKDDIEIGFNSKINETINLVILDAVGKDVYSKNIESIIGENSIILNELTYLKTGIYFARLTNKDGISQLIKLVKN